MKKTDEPVERRKGSRHYITSENVTVKILFSSENPVILGKQFKTIDISKNSLRLEIAHSIEVGSVLDIALTIDGSKLRYNLTGNVRWRLPAATPGVYQLGLVLRERTDTLSDLKAWQQHFDIAYAVTNEKRA